MRIEHTSGPGKVSVVTFVDRFFFIRNLVPLLLLAVMGTSLTGCSSSSETAAPDRALSGNVGLYPPGPSGVAKPRVGIPSFKVTTAGSFSGGADLNDLAADQANTLLYKTGRFTVIERTQLQKLIDEQNLEGIVKAGELAKPGKVRGVDYLLIGRVTNLRVKQEHTSKGFGLAQVGGIIGGLDVKKKDTKITTDCGVDIRLVDPTTGEVMVAENSEFSRTDSAGAMGVAILGVNAEADASINLSQDDKGKILRLALDDAIRKSLPDIDAFLARRGNPTNSGTPTPPAPGGAATGTPPAAVNPSESVAAKKFCPNCGHEVTPGAKFCPSCGKPI